MARIVVRKNFRFENALKDLTPTERDMRRAGEELAVKIENRTLSGRDENNQPFAPLAQPKYGKDKADLHDTGQMFGDFGVVKATTKSVGLGFRTRRSERIADYHQAGTRNMPARPFLGVTDRWVADIMRRLFRRRR